MPPVQSGLLPEEQEVQAKQPSSGFLRPPPASGRWHEPDSSPKPPLPGRFWHPRRKAATAPCPTPSRPLWRPPRARWFRNES